MANWKEPRIDYKATDQVVPSIFNILGENERYLQEVKITTEQVQNAVIASVENSIRQNLTDNETVKVAFGKIRKYFADLGALAFKTLVGNADLAELAISEGKLGLGAVSTDKLKDLSVTTSKLADVAVTAVKIAANAITNEKILSVAASKVTGLASVATSGDYNDLKNKPSVPSGVEVIDNLTSTSRTAALSAYQGKVLNDRLNELGFKEGVATYTGTAMNANVTNSLLKFGKLAIFNFGVMITAATRPLTITIPDGFRPKKAVKCACGMYASGSLGQAEMISIPTSGVFNGLGNQAAFITNVGWEVA